MEESKINLKCPACGTLNANENTICSSCGYDFNCNEQANLKTLKKEQKVIDIINDMLIKNQDKINNSDEYIEYDDELDDVNFEIEECESSALVYFKQNNILFKIVILLFSIAIISGGIYLINFIPSSFSIANLLNGVCVCLFWLAHIFLVIGYIIFYFNNRKGSKLKNKINRIGAKFCMVSWLFFTIPIFYVLFNVVYWVVKFCLFDPLFIQLINIVFQNSIQLASISIFIILFLIVIGALLMLFFFTQKISSFKQLSKTYSDFNYEFHDIITETVCEFLFMLCGVFFIGYANNFLSLTVCGSMIGAWVIHLVWVHFTSKKMFDIES